MGHFWLACMFPVSKEKAFFKANCRRVCKNRYLHLHTGTDPQLPRSSIPPSSWTGLVLVSTAASYTCTYMCGICLGLCIFPNAQKAASPSRCFCLCTKLWELQLLCFQVRVVSSGRQGAKECWSVRRGTHEQRNWHENRNPEKKVMERNKKENGIPYSHAVPSNVCIYSNRELNCDYVATRTFGKHLRCFQLGNSNNRRPATDSKVEKKELCTQLCWSHVTQHRE